MHGQWIGLGLHFFQCSLGFMNRLAQMVQGVLEPICSHHVHSISGQEGQFPGSVLIENQSRDSVSDRDSLVPQGAAGWPPGELLPLCPAYGADESRINLVHRQTLADIAIRSKAKSFLQCPLVVTRAGKDNDWKTRMARAE